MKKLFTIAVLLLSVMTVFAQTPRLVLWEQFTNTGCGPCAGFNPSAEQYWNDNPDKVVPISYHVSWPSPNDPMYNHNPADNGARRSLYGLNSVPWTVIDGNKYSANSSMGPITTAINNQLDVPAPFEINVNYRLSDDNDSIYVTMLVKATQEITGDLKAHIAVIEKHIHLGTQPNGESDFYNVMKKMLPTANGTSLPGSMDADDYFIITEAWELANVYDVAELSVIGFVQDKTSKEVHQAIMGSTDPITPVYDNDAETMGISNINTTYCDDAVTPKVTFRNNGSALTSLTFEYKVNNGENQTYVWTGSMDFLETATIELPEIQFPLSEENTLTITSTNPNGEADQASTNNEQSTTFLAAPLTGTTITMILRTDNNPEETTWDIKNSAGDVIHSGGPYTEGSAFVVFNEDFEVETGDCFTFTIYDAAGNGMKNGNGTGAYQLKDKASGNVFVEGGEFAFEEKTQFKVTSVGIESITQASNSLNIYPNPVTRECTITCNLLKNENVTVTVFDNMGRMVYSKDHGQMAKGVQNINFNADNLNSGVYFMREIGRAHV